MRDWTEVVPTTELADVDHGEDLEFGAIAAAAELADVDHGEGFELGAIRHASSTSPSSRFSPDQGDANAARGGRARAELADLVELNRGGRARTKQRHDDG